MGRRPPRTALSSRMAMSSAIGAGGGGGASLIACRSRAPVAATARSRTDRGWIRPLPDLPFPHPPPYGSQVGGRGRERRHVRRVTPPPPRRHADDSDTDVSGQPAGLLAELLRQVHQLVDPGGGGRKSTRLNSSHLS